uniref:putative mediator of RNA polymerase II transcription subunit 26 isoform X2 n=1 Tax=Fragaria vesca subsp. vesca TaxID=101020 RepID=UPI0005CAB377|nr:PREDICTED: putative mediator of RNA polymerase II transcription subunit 26 isoform X2 [Fragaria vesca subsp. vesca]
MQYIFHFNALLQDEDHQAEKVIKEKVVQSSHLSLELTASEQSCQRISEKEEQQTHKQLHFQGRKSAESDHGVAMAPEFQIEEKTRELKTSTEETGQRQLQQRQLQPRTKNLSESKRSMLSNTGMPQLEKSGVEVSSQLKKQSQVEKPGVGDSSQPKQKQVDCSNKLTQKQQMPWDMKLRSRNQATSQCEPDVMMIESPSSKHPCEQPQEQKHPKQPHKQKGRPPKSKLDRAAPTKRQKLQEQLERERPPKLDENTISGRELISKNK